MISQEAKNNKYGMDPPQNFCIKGSHLLKWKSGGGTCAMCKKTGCRSRYYCTTCNEPYCLQCIPPPLFGIICGAGHEMQKAEVPYHICDHCSATIQSEAYRCVTCDFDICLNCYIQRED
ncbi:hypothetical protein pb186bvf_019022 [Paramecium bursaria]